MQGEKAKDNVYDARRIVDQRENRALIKFRSFDRSKQNKKKTYLLLKIIGQNLK